MSQVNNILDWCNSHIALVKILKINFDEFVLHEVPKIETYFAQRNMITEASIEFNNTVDKFMFMLGMMAPINFLKVLFYKNMCLKQMVTNVITVKKHNTYQLQYIIDTLGESTCSHLIHLHLK